MVSFELQADWNRKRLACFQGWSFPCFGYGFSGSSWAIPIIFKSTLSQQLQQWNQPFGGSLFHVQLTSQLVSSVWFNFILYVLHRPQLSAYSQVLGLYIPTLEIVLVWKKRRSLCLCTEFYKDLMRLTTDELLNYYWWITDMRFPICILLVCLFTLYHLTN